MDVGPYIENVVQIIANSNELFITLKGTDYLNYTTVYGEMSTEMRSAVYKCFSSFILKYTITT